MTRILPFVCLLLAACSHAGGAPARSGPETRGIDLIAPDVSYRTEMVTRGAAVLALPAPVERVWAALPQVYAQLGLEAQVLDAERRSYGMPETSVRRRLAGAPLSRFLDCGHQVGVANADSYTVRLSVTTQLHSLGPGSTQHRTHVVATARSTGGSGHAVTCGTTNELERRIAAHLSRYFPTED